MDFEKKGYIFSEKIKELDGSNVSDFYFPVDCDEFIVVEESTGDVRIDTASIVNELRTYDGSTAPLAIGTAFDNNPMAPGFFYREAGQRKTFFSKNTCWTLDLGFHDGKTKTGEQAHKTKIAYVHFHYKVFEQYVDSAKQKLQGRVQDFSRKSLEEFSEQRLAGFHLIGTLLGGRDKYYQSHYNRFKKHSNSFYQLDHFNLIMNRLGLNFDDVHPTLAEAFDKKVPRWKGYVDTVEVTSKGVELNGWAVSLYDFNLFNTIFCVNGIKGSVVEVVRFERNDVVKNVAYAEPHAGLKMLIKGKFKKSELDPNAIEIYIDDSGTRFDYSYSGTLV